jgi:hypothetical protein
MLIRAVITVVAVTLLVMIGATRAGVEYGTPGLIAYVKFTLTPVALIVALYVWAFPVWKDGGFVWLPSRRAQVVIAWVTGVTTCWILVATAMFGVGWLVRR